MEAKVRVGRPGRRDPERDSRSKRRFEFGRSTGNDTNAPYIIDAILVAGLAVLVLRWRIGEPEGEYRTGACATASD